MIPKEVKNTIIENLNKKYSNNSFNEDLKNFVLTFNGSNEKEFFNFFLSLETLLINIQINEIQSEGYRELKNLSEEYNSIIDDLRKEYSDISSRKIPASRAVLSSKTIEEKDHKIQQTYNKDNS